MPQEKVLLIHPMPSKCTTTAAARASVLSKPLRPCSFDPLEAIVFFRNVDYDYRSWWGDRVRRQPN